MNPPAGCSTSVWMTAAIPPVARLLEESLQADVCIVGAGIAGLTTAYLLTREGKSVVVLDDGPLVSGETARTTAHLASALDDRFFELERLHGQGGARLAAECHAAAIDCIERIVTEKQIACGFERIDGFLFAGAGTAPEFLERELAAAHRAGLLDTTLVDRLPLETLNAGRALRFPRQAQFHPLQYLGALAATTGRAGGRLFTGTHAAEFHGGRQARVRTAAGFDVACGAIVVATNTPVNDRVAIHTRQAAYRTYVIGVQMPHGSVPKALYWDTEDPYHYMRLLSAEGSFSPPADDLLIVGGEDHKTGQGDDLLGRYGRLETWTRARFPQAGEIGFRWSGQVMEPADGLAFIGRNPLDDENVYIATGDSGHGITHGTIAGLLLADLIVGRANPWAELYSPGRITVGAAETYAWENVNTALQYIDWLTAGDVDKDARVPPGTGAVVRRCLTKVAVYRGADGTLHECSAMCPHLGGIVTWNHAERTWDSPAHGSRFDPRGAVLNGPANSNLSATTPTG